MGSRGSIIIKYRDMLVGSSRLPMRESRQVASHNQESVGSQDTVSILCLLTDVGIQGIVSDVKSVIITASPNHLLILCVALLSIIMCQKRDSGC